MKFTETMLNNYSQPLSQTEDQQCKNAISMVVNALKPLGFQEKETVWSPCMLKHMHISKSLNLHLGKNQGFSTRFVRKQY